MKKSFSVNIDGRIFNIDEDAYDLLQSYLKQLGTAFGNGDDSDEGEFIRHYPCRLESLTLLIA